MLDYSLAQVHGYLAGHEADEAAERVRLMDAVRIAANADADDYRRARDQMCEPLQVKAEEPAWQRAKRAFERAGSLRSSPAD